MYLHENKSRCRWAKHYEIMHSPTAQQPNSPTAQQPNSPTAQQPNSPTAQQPNSPTAVRAKGLWFVLKNIFGLRIKELGLPQILNRKSLIIICIFANCLLPTISFSQGTWTQMTNLPAAGRAYNVGFSIGAKGYIATGSNSPTLTTYLNDFWEWDGDPASPNYNTWTQKVNFPGAGRIDAVAFSVGGKGYVGTGYSATANYDDIWEYDPSGNLWLPKANFPKMMRGAVAFAIAGKGYIGTGYDGVTGVFTKDLYMYDPGLNQWFPKAPFPGAGRAMAAGFSIGTKGYIGTGWSGGVQPQYGDFYEYNSLNDTWAQKANIPIGPRAECCGFSIQNCCGNGYGYIGLGTIYLGSGDVADFYQYDPVGDVWTPMAPFSGLREQMAEFSIGCKGYVCTGAINDTWAASFADLWEFAPNIPNAVANAGLDQTICTGATVTLSAATADTFLWAPSTGLNCATCQNPVTTPAITTTYTLIIGGTVCSDTDYVTVTVNNPPIVNLQDTTLCGTANIILDAGNQGSAYQWSTGASSSSVTITATGTYWVIASVGACKDSDTAVVTFNSIPIVSLGNDGTICLGDSMILNAGNPGSSYLWSTGVTTQTITVSGAGNYWVIVAQNNCLATDTVQTFIPPSVQLFDSSLCEMAPIILDAGSGASSYLWSTGDTTQTISVDFAGQYWVQVMYGNCKSADTSAITGVAGGSALYIPNCFTPNDDNLNETFSAKGIGVVSFELNIFDRWGNLLFVSDDINNGWNGEIQGGHYLLKDDGDEPAQEDVYVWLIKYTTDCEPNLPKKTIGHVSIVK